MRNLVEYLRGLNPAHTFEDGFFSLLNAVMHRFIIYNTDSCPLKSMSNRYSFKISCNPKFKY